MKNCDMGSGNISIMHFVQHLVLAMTTCQSKKHSDSSIYSENSKTWNIIVSDVHPATLRVLMETFGVICGV